MSGFPSMTALLGLLAVAGYQNRDKLGELLGSIGQQKPGTPARAAPGLGGLLSNMSSALKSPGGLLSGGLSELIDRFKANGQGETADSWVKNGPNKEVAPDQLKKAIGPDVLADLTKQTGLTEQDILARLSKNLPDAVDKYTPEGRLPS